MISAAGTLCVAFLSEPTDPDAGTNRTNAVSRDNLMEGAGLRYDGRYVNAALNNIDTNGSWWSSTIMSTIASHTLGVGTDGGIYPKGSNSNKNYGRAVR